MAWLNNNHEVFGKNKRPIVSFAVDDKRELHKQKKRKEWKEAAVKRREAEAEKGGTKGAESAKGKGGGKIDGKEKRVDAKAPEAKDKGKLAFTKATKAAKPKQLGRGAKQRMKRRLERESGTQAAKAEPAPKRQKTGSWPPQRAAERAVPALPPGKRRKVAAQPAAQPAGRSGRPKRTSGLSDDFEARMMNSWR